MRAITLLFLQVITYGVAAQNVGGLLEDCRFNDQSPTDNLTYLCLLGVTAAREPKWCAEIDPAYGKAAAEAHQAWLIRNADFVRDFQSACVVRIRKAYGHDESAIGAAKEDAKARYDKMKAQFVAADCSTYIHYKNEEGKQPYLPPKLLQSIRDCAVRPTHGPNK